MIGHFIKNKKKVLQKLPLKLPLKMIPFSQQLSKDFLTLTMQMIRNWVRLWQMTCKMQSCLLLMRLYLRTTWKSYLNKEICLITAKQDKQNYRVIFSTVSPAIRKYWLFGNHLFFLQSLWRTTNCVIWNWTDH